MANKLPLARGWGYLVKKLIFAAVLTFVFSSSAVLRAQNTKPCPTAVGCTAPVPEPSSLPQFVAGLLVLGGLIVLGRKRFVRN